MIYQRLSGSRGIERKAVGRMLLLTLTGVAMFFALAAWSFTGTAAAVETPAGTVVKNPFEGKPEAIKEGEKIFDAKCADCHGGDAMGQSGPDLTDDSWSYGGSDAEVFETVTNGRKGGMPSWRSELNKDDIWKVIAYVRSLKKK
jgi:cbb3-type cytochrome c oxidase subunit III